MASSETERWHVLYWIGEVQLSLSEEANEEEQKECVRKAYDAINASIALFQGNEEVKKFAETEDMKAVIQFNLTNRARCEIKLGEVDKAIATMDEAYTVTGDDADSSLDEKFINDITASLEKAGEFKKLISVIGHFRKWDLMSWIGFGNTYGHEIIQHAAW